MSGYTQAQLDSLRQAAAQGIKEVTVDGKKVVYSSTSEMLRLIAVIEAALAQPGQNVTHYQPRFVRGL